MSGRRLQEGGSMFGVEGNGRSSQPRDDRRAGQQFKGIQEPTAVDGRNGRLLGGDDD